MGIYDYIEVLVHGSVRMAHFCCSCFIEFWMGVGERGTKGASCEAANHDLQFNLFAFACVAQIN